MGYYDQDYEGRYKKQKGNKGGLFLASLLGAILGALLVIVAIPQLSNLNVLPYNIAPNESGQTADNNHNQDPGTTRNVSLNVTSDITQAVEKAGDAVVGISNIQTTNFWSENDGGEPAGTGSGVIYKKAGDRAYVVTNHHVIAGARSLEVSLPDGAKVPAELLGSDVLTDLAVLEIDGKEVKSVAEFGNSEALNIGEPVIAIGNPLGPIFSGSVTQGIISGLERTIPVDINEDGVVDWNAEVIQTDAAINPGNSGGALVNIQGQVIGINSMKIAQQAVEGIGLTIPITFAQPIINDLEEFGEVRRPYMGIDLRSVNEIAAYYQQEALKLPRDVDYGVAIVGVQPNSPAAQAGLQEMDVIVEMDGGKITDVLALRKHLYNEKEIGEQLTITYYRNGRLQEATMTLTGESL